MAYSQYFSGHFDQNLPNAAIVNNTAPTFSGVSSVTPNASGAFGVAWSAASGAAATPIRYEIYVALGTVLAAALFNSSNLVKVVQGVTSSFVDTLGDQTTYFVNGQTYTFGVRAVSAVGVSDNNTAVSTSTAIGSGNVPVALQTAITDLEASKVSIQNSASLIAATVL